MCRLSLRQFIENKCKTHVGGIVKNSRSFRTGGKVIMSDNSRNISPSGNHKLPGGEPSLCSIDKTVPTKTRKL